MMPRLGQETTTFLGEPIVRVFNPGRGLFYLGPSSKASMTVAVKPDDCFKCLMNFYYSTGTCTVALGLDHCRMIRSVCTVTCIFWQKHWHWETHVSFSPAAPGVSLATADPAYDLDHDHI